MKPKTLLKSLAIILIASILVLCKKDPDGDGNHDEPLVFTSLTASRDTIFAGDTTHLTAVATGYALTYHWSVAKGDLIGSGSRITFLATPCTVGTNTVVCTVRDGNDREIQKEVNITVL